jgi:hypothetical protein
MLSEGPRKKECFELNGTNQLLVCADDVHTYISQRKTESLLEESGNVCLEVNTEKIKYMVLSYKQNVEENHNLLTVNKSFEYVAKFKNLGTTVTN